MVLRCSAEPPTAGISWLLDGEPLGSGLPGVQIQHGSLSIASLSTATAGRYQCVASSSAGAVLSRAAVVSMGSKSVWFVFLTPREWQRPQCVCVVCFPCAAGESGAATRCGSQSLEVCVEWSWEDALCFP